MPKHDLVHFDQYSPQNRAKHAILTAYLPAYLTALKNQVQWFHYIDGFAGRGVYADQFPGSPLLALRKITDAGLAARATVSLVESSETFLTELTAAMTEDPLTAGLAEAPLIRYGRFADQLPELLRRPIYDKAGRVATFAFIDPCGVEGVRMDNLVELLRKPFGEVLLFFNYDAVSRLVGAYVAGSTDRRILDDLFGDPGHVDHLIAELASVADPADREAVIRSQFMRALAARSGARYFVPFRFDARSQDRTSHYLVHCSYHQLAFRIMKHVMWKAGSDETDPLGKLEFLNDRERGRQFALFRPDTAEQEARIIAHLRGGPCPVRVFSQEWVDHPDDPYSEQVYKRTLLRLEAQGRIVVFDARNVQPKPVQSRRMHKGSPTLGNDLYVRLGVG